MSDSCTTGLTYLFHCYEETHTEIYNAIAEDAYRSTSKDGMVGEPLPYQLRSDWMVTSLMFICFVLVSYVLMRSSKYIQSQFSFFFSNKDRYGLFDNNTSSDVRYALILLSQTVLFSGFCLYDFFSTYDKFLFASVPHVYLLLLFIIVIALFILIKWAVYMFINWIFFYKTKQKLWISSFSSVIIWSGFLLFPIVLLIVYFDLNAQISVILFVIVILIGKILLFYKCFSNFFNKFYGILHLILYFCALEVIPDLILWKSILLANNSLVLNF
jgi:hypothetical protein